MIAQLAAAGQRLHVEVQKVSVHCERVSGVVSNLSHELEVVGSERSEFDVVQNPTLVSREPVVLEQDLRVRGEAGSVGGVEWVGRDRLHV